MLKSGTNVTVSENMSCVTLTISGVTLWRVTSALLLYGRYFIYFTIIVQYFTYFLIYY